jgi:hypothetical protein
VTPTETAQLVRYWIDRLTRKKKEYIASLEPSPYDLLPYEAKLSIAISRIEEQKVLDLDYQISFNNLVRSHAATRRQRYLERSKQTVFALKVLTYQSNKNSHYPISEPSRNHSFLNHSKLRKRTQ